MKATILIGFLMICCCVNSMNAQDTITSEMIYNTTVKLISDPSFKCYGALYEVNDSSISISSKRIKDYYSGSVEASEFPVEDVKVIHIQKPRSVGRGALIGAASGIALGILTGAVSEEGWLFDRSEMIIGLAAFGLIVGAPTGAIVGKIAGHKSIPIRGSIDEYNMNKDKLKGYSILK